MQKLIANYQYRECLELTNMPITPSLRAVSQLMRTSSRTPPEQGQLSLLHDNNL